MILRQINGSKQENESDKVRRKIEGTTSFSSESEKEQSALGKKKGYIKKQR